MPRFDGGSLYAAHRDGAKKRPRAKPGLEHEVETILKTAEVLRAHNNPTPLPTPVNAIKNLQKKRDTLSDVMKW